MTSERLKIGPIRPIIEATELADSTLQDEPDANLSLLSSRPG
jgi:hypothetical protein